MTDKVQRIREEVERLRSLHQIKYQQLDADNSMSLVECGKRNLCNELLSFIDSFQEEPVKIKKGCKYRSICNVTNNDTGNISFVAGKIYLAPEDDTLVSEENGWLCDTSEDASNFELVEGPLSIWHDASEKPERDDLLIETNDGRIIHRQSINNYGMVKRWAYTSALLNIDNSYNLRNNSQEEPVSVWHNSSEEPNDMSHCLIFYGCKDSVGHYLHYEPVLYNKKDKVFVTPSLPHPTGYKRNRISISDITQWCYLYDLHNLSNVERTGKDWKEEPVSEDLNDEIRKYFLSYKGYPHVMDETEREIKKAIIYFANWQKEQDQSTIELAEDHAMLAGMNKMKEEMMKDAVEVTVHIDAGNYPYIPQIELYDYDKDVPLAKAGDKYKVVLIKEE